MVLVGIVLAVALVAFFLKWAPDLLAKKGLRARDEAEELGRVRTALLASVAGLIAIVGAVFTGLSYRLNRAGQITERFTRAIDQLGSRELDVRLGDIYALERIARDSADDHPQVVEVLTAYVREHSAWRPTRPQSREPAARTKEIEAIRAIERIARGAHTHAAETDMPPASEEQSGVPDLPTDVQAVMSVLGRRDPSRDRSGAALNLANTDLRRVRLLGEQAHFDGAQLVNSHLERAVLVEAHLENADLSRAHLEGASLADAYLDSAELSGAHLEGVLLNVAHLNGAYLIGAHLEGADLSAADLTGTDLSGAHLEGAVLNGTLLNGAWLIGTRLKGAEMGEVGLRGALYDDATTWPDGFDFKAAGAQRAGAEEQEFGAVLRSD